MRPLLVAAVLVAASRIAAAASFPLALLLGACCGGGDPQFGVAVAAAGTAIAAGIPSQTFGAVAVFDRRTGALRDVLGSPAPSTDFGRALAAHAGDLFVGAPDVRAVYAFGAGTATPRTTFADPNPVAPPDAAGLDEFGAAVAVGGTLVAVGAPGDATYGTNAGAVYVFTRDTGALLRRLDAAGPFAGARFGAAVAIAGGDVVVGAPSPDLPGAGAVHVFAGRTGALRWSVSEPPALGDRLFGWAVAASGRRIVVGVPCRDVQQNAGTAVVYDRRSGAALASFTAPVPEACDFFGGAVAAAGRTIVIGARLTGSQDTGAAYAFDAESGGLVATFADGTPEADVGWSVAAAPHRVVIGAAGEDGAVRVYGKTH